MQVGSGHVPSLPQALSSYLDLILQDACHDATHMAVGLSGGPDSMALVLLAHDWCLAYGKQLTALTVDHQLRTESALEARQVAHWMRERRIPHQILTPAPRPDIANIQARARQLRYDALTQWCHMHQAQTLLLAHHFDDQAETVALQKHRGPTPPSRAGMALVSMRGATRLVRPLLGVRKAHLVAYLEQRGAPWIEDASNDSDFFSRNRLRRILTEPARQELWAEAKRAGEERHHDDQARMLWLARYANIRQRKMVIDARAWRALEEIRRTDVLSHAIRHMGGKEFRPRYHETLRLDSRIVQEPAGKATLGRCVIRWQDDALAIEPERALAAVGSQAYMTPENAPKPLVSEPFWWFNYSPFSFGAALAPHQ